MPRHAVLEPITTDLTSHPAVEMWSRLRPGAVEPLAVTPLKPQRKASHKSGVYRLHGVGPEGSNVIAKRCRRSTAVRERTVYEQILPQLALPTLHYYGSIEETEAPNTWLFVEDAGDVESGEDDREHFIRWLAQLHTSAADATARSGLAERGPARYLEHLQSARGRINANLAAPHFLPDELDVLHRTLALCEAMENRWNEIEQFCQRMPKTLVHGDMSRKNLRVRRTSSGVQFFAIDWETAGLGVPAADLGATSQRAPDQREAIIEIYRSVVAPVWRCDAGDIETLAHVGLLFRMAASIDWVTYSLPYPPGRKPVKYFRAYEEHVLGAMDRLGWKHPGRR